MDWTTGILLAFIALGVFAGVVLAVKDYMTNPQRWWDVIIFFTAKLIPFVIHQLIPRVLAYIFARKSAEEEKKDHDKVRQGEERNKSKYR